MPLSDIALKTYYYRMRATELTFLQPTFLNPLSAGVTDRQTDRVWTDRQTDRVWTDRQTDGRTHRQSDKQTDKQTL